MVSRAVARYVRMSPRKIRYVLDLVRGKPVPMAYDILDQTPRRACLTVRRLIQQAADSALKQREIGPENLKVARIFADGAGMMKRFRSMSMGRAGMIRKRLSHLVVELDSARGAEAPPAAKSAAPSKGHKPAPKPAEKAKPAARVKTAKRLAGAK